MDASDLIVALVAVLAGFGIGYAFRGWYARRRTPSNFPSGVNR